MKEYHLTTPQKNIFNLMQYYEDTSIGNQCGAIFFREKRDQKLLYQALRQVITHQKGLRLRFRKEKEPVQYVSDEIGEISVMTFDTRSEYEDFAQEFAKDPIGWKDQVMYRFVIFELEDRSGILAVMSHLISDAWTFGLMADQVKRVYRSLAEGSKIL